MKGRPLKIDRVTLYHIELPLKAPFVTSFGTVETRGTLLIKLDSEGLVGWGTAAHLPAPVYVPEFLEAGKLLLANHILPRVVGKVLSSPGEVVDCYKGLRGNNLSKAGLETAAWDLFAAAVGQPLYQYMGGDRNSVEVGVSIGVKDRGLLLDEVAQAVDEGYKRIKVKISPGSDVKVVAAIRDRFSDFPLMVDANSAYTLGDIDTLKELDRCNLMMIEQPLGPDDIIDHAKLQQQVETPICLDESILSAEDARKAAELGSCRIINIKPGRVGGLAESLKILEICRAHDLGAWIGGMLESGLGRAFLNHLAVQDGVNLPGDLTPSSSYLQEDIVDGPAVRNGTILLGDEPGIGVQIKEDVLHRHLQEKIEITG